MGNAKKQGLSLDLDPEKGKENRIPSKKVAGIVQTVSALSSPLTLLEISQTQSGKFPLSWSHYVRLLSLDEPQKRDFYEEEAQRAGCVVRLVRAAGGEVHIQVEQRPQNKKGSVYRKQGMKKGA